MIRVMDYSVYSRERKRYVGYLQQRHWFIENIRFHTYNQAYPFEMEVDHSKFLRDGFELLLFARDMYRVSKYFNIKVDRIRVRSMVMKDDPSFSGTYTSVQLDNIFK